jgi:isoleucyl-tRNA synthetase
VDFVHDYKTLDLSYMESVMWAFKTLWDKGLIYEGFRVLWYCWRCETPLSNTETKMDDVYRDRQDPAVTVGLRLNSAVPELQGVEALVWTTTPWTLPSNLAAAVHPDVSYVVVQAANGRKYLLAEARVAAYARELGESPAVLAKFIGKRWSERYTPPFDFFAVAKRTRTRSIGRLRRPKTAPAWCTSRRRTARKTRSLPTPPASNQSRP